MLLTRKKKRLRVEILPLIDVIFFLLVFFMLFTTFDINPSGIHIDLPKAVTASTQQPSNLTVVVDRTGVFHLDGNTVATSELQRRVKEGLDRRPDLFVIIKADKEARYDHVIRAMDAVRAVGGHRLGLAVEREQ